MPDQLANGDEFYRAIDVGGIILEVLAEVEIVGDQLHLRDLAVYPQGTDRGTVGAAEVYRAFRQEIIGYARRLGFVESRITATRLTGMNPGHRVDRVIRIEPQ
ncbi:MAG: hypothetical protein ACYCS2_02385 [Acidimicrobiales bacterium]